MNILEPCLQRKFALWFDIITHSLNHYSTGHCIPSVQFLYLGLQTHRHTDIPMDSQLYLQLMRVAHGSECAQSGRVVRKYFSEQVMFNIDMEKNAK